MPEILPMPDRSVSRGQVMKLERFIDLLLHPEEYGCSFDKGDPETYQERAGYIVDDAAAILDGFRPYLPPIKTNTTGTPTA